MLLVCVPFDLRRGCLYLHKKAHREPIPTRLNLCAKIVQVLASLGYLIFDTVKQDAPGPWLTALVVLACLFDMFGFPRLIQDHDSGRGRLLGLRRS
jgi:hypothetical protein